MIDYGRVYGNNRPQEIQITSSLVFVASNIQAYEKNIDDHIEKGFEYDLIQYDKDEYIQLIAIKNSNLENQLLITQEAVCDLYEMLSE